MSVKIIYFVHGTTTDNEEHKSTGQNPGVLSELGKKQSIESRNKIDLWCGLGRHSILFGKNEFNVSCFDISQEVICWFYNN